MIMERPQAIKGRVAGLGGLLETPGWHVRALSSRRRSGVLIVSRSGQFAFFVPRPAIVSQSIVIVVVFVGRRPAWLCGAVNGGGSGFVLEYLAAKHAIFFPDLLGSINAVCPLADSHNGKHGHDP